MSEAQLVACGHARQDTVKRRYDAGLLVASEPDRI